jgi:hypothetical protein
MPRAGKLHLEGTGEPVPGVRREDEAVVSEEGLGKAQSFGGFVEGSHHVRGSGGDEGVAGHTEPRVVVDDVEHLEDHPVGPLDVGDVGLPALVGQVGAKALP